MARFELTLMRDGVPSDSIATDDPAEAHDWFSARSAASRIYIKDNLTGGGLTHDSSIIARNLHGKPHKTPFGTALGHTRHSNRENGPTHAVAVNISAADVALLERIGGGNRSRGCRILCESFRMLE